MKILRKLVKSSLAVAVVTLMIVALGTTGYAFHSGGVAECMGCHNIHDGQSASALLVGSDISSTCLSCHGQTSAGSYHIASMDVGGTNNGLVPRQMTPGGDFGWLLKTYTWSPRSGTSETEQGYEHGHSIVAADYGFVSDGTNTVAPGGNMDASLLSCNSCHDNHGKLRRYGLITNPTWGVTGAPIIASGSYKSSPDPAAGQAVGAYRLLRGPGSTAGSGGKTFTVVFNAIAPDTYNRSESSTAPTRVAYGFGISEWCATCHPDMHTANSSKMTHPVSQGLSATEVANYNSYLGSGLKTGVTAANSYDSIVPFQTDNTRNYTLLKSLANSDGSNRNGPQGTTDRVMCLSCHRAHASGFAHMTRWQNESEFIAVDGVWPGTDSPSSVASQAKYAMGRTTAETQASYNGKDMAYASYQRSLCNKCHAKD
jgi:predicted CXXCH cytochrome family protein